MKKLSMFMTGFSCLFFVSCGGLGNLGSTTTSSSNASGILGSVLGAVTNGETLGNVISSVIGADKLTQKTIIGTWHYSGAGCAFTSDNALARAGGEVAAVQIEEKLQPQYDKLGFSSSNTYITLKEDGTYSAKINGQSLSGKYSFDENSAQLKLQGLLLSITGYAKRNIDGISILFESKKLLTLLQTVAAISGNTTLETVGEISKNYDGVRLGFDMKK